MYVFMYVCMCSCTCWHVYEIEACVPMQGPGVWVTRKRGEHTHGLECGVGERKGIRERGAWGSMGERKNLGGGRVDPSFTHFSPT